MAKLVLFLVVMVAVWEASSGLSICNLSDQAFKACKPAVAQYGATNPSPACCKAVKGLSAYDIQCLCDFKNNSPSMLQAFGVDPGRCMQLPGLCGSSVPVNC